MVEVRRKEKETTGALMRRFTRKVQQSRVLLDARSQTFRSRPKSKTKKKRDAIRRVAKRQEYERLRKLGKIS